MSTRVGHFIGGQAVGGTEGGDSVAVQNPATGDTIASVALGAIHAADQGVQAGVDAFEAWSMTPVGERVQCLFRYKQVLEDHFEELASLIVSEHGKTMAEARGDVRRGIDCVEFACAAPVLMMGNTLPQIAVSSSFCRSEDEGGVGIDSTSERVPLGVCVGITPFNFPVMVPLWMWPIAVACGNTFVLKPSEKVPLSALREIELTAEAGFPAGVINVVTGGPDVANHLITHKDVRAVSFVGSTKVARHIYTTASAAGKRAQCMGGAKNFMVIMPDANREAVIDGVLGSAFGNSGQRCLAGSVAAPVGEAAEWFVPAIVEAAKGISVRSGDDPEVSMGPVIDEASRERIAAYLDIGEQEGASLVLDGRMCEVPEGGCYIGASVFDRVTPTMRICQEEIFGPVLSIVRTETLDGAIDALNSTDFGNMGVIFTSSGHSARRFKTQAKAGMIGINVGVPAPMSVFPFAGWKNSFFGDLHANGEDAVRFYTEHKILVSRWI